MKKWIFIVLTILIVAASTITGIVLSQSSDSYFVFNISAITLEVNSSKKIEYKCSENCEVSFSTDNEEIAKVIDDKVYAFAVGQAYLKAEIQHNNKTYLRYAKITVTEESGQYYFDYEDSRNISFGSQTSFSPVVTKGNINPTYISSDNSTATIGTDGKINTIKCGYVDISVIIEGQIVKTCHVTIIAHFTIDSFENCDVVENNVSVADGEWAVISISITNYQDSIVLSNHNCTISATNDLEFELVYGKLRFHTHSNSTLTINYTTLNTTITINVNVI